MEQNESQNDARIEDPITINIGNIAGGAVVEAFDLKMAEVLANIMDLNTPATAARTIILKIKLKPREDRVQIGVEFTCDTSVPGFVPATSRLFVGMDAEKNLYALKDDPRQIALFTPPKPREAPPVIAFKTS